MEEDASVSLLREGVSLGAVETSLLKLALTRSGGNKTRAAELLGLTRDQFRYRLKKLDGPDSGQLATAELNASYN